MIIIIHTEFCLSCSSLELDFVSFILTLFALLSKIFDKYMYVEQNGHISL